MGLETDNRKWQSMEGSPHPNTTVVAVSLVDWAHRAAGPRRWWKAVRGGRFVQSVQISDSARQAFGDLYDPDTPKYEVQMLEGDTFRAALSMLAGVG
ncbi:MAG: hypothetical protein COS85_10470 [Armatimonadetes bacterium CG07_land_8_20_14_0_80_59_28]|nr:MAG: hypothetical protein COS85_10470 [Armatimonadetes bacterium CG07_land_8_20_14_0_80_59_28]